MNRDTQAFEAAWTHFETVVKGKLLEKVKKQDVEAGLANIILRDAALCWSSPYGAEGRWLSQFTEAAPEKGKAILSLLQREMKLTEAAAQPAVSPYLKYGVAAVGAVVGGGITGIFTSKLIPQLIGAAVPAIALYPMMNEREKAAQERGKMKALEGYMEQLESYRLRVVRLIEG